MDDLDKFEQCIGNYLDEHFECWGFVGFDKNGNDHPLMSAHSVLDKKAIRQAMRDYLRDLEVPLPVINEHEVD